MDRVRNIIKFLISIIVCLTVGVVGGVVTSPQIPAWYASLRKPVFSPPNWVFAPVWTLLYFLMGISVFLIWQKGEEKKKVKKALGVFAGQLGLNFLWSIFFFGLRSPILGLIDILFLWGMIIWAVEVFYPLNKTAALLLLPYFLWVSFASVLNAVVFFLN